MADTLVTIAIIVQAVAAVAIYFLNKRLATATEAYVKKTDALAIEATRSNELVASEATRRLVREAAFLTVRPRQAEGGASSAFVRFNWDLENVGAGAAIRAHLVTEAGGSSDLQALPAEAKRGVFLEIERDKVRSDTTNPDIERAVFWDRDGTRFEQPYDHQTKGLSSPRVTLESA